MVVALTAAGAAHAGEAIVELRSPGDYRSLSIAAPIAEVALIDAFNGACRLNRTWGYDLGARTLWVNGGRSGRFRVVTHEPAPYPPAPVVVAPPPTVVVGAPAPLPVPAATPARHIQGMNNLCLDIAGGAKKGHGAIVYKCNRGDNQHFSYTSAGELRVDGYCLDVQGESHDDGARAIAWKCNGQPNQRWRLQGHAIRSDMTGKCLTVQDGRGVAGTPVVLHACSGRANQRWWL